MSLVSRRSCLPRTQWPFTPWGWGLRWPACVTGARSRLLLQKATLCLGAKGSPKLLGSPPPRSCPGSRGLGASAPPWETSTPVAPGAARAFSTDSWEGANATKWLLL